MTPRSRVDPFSLDSRLYENKRDDCGGESGSLMGGGRFRGVK